MRRPCLFLALLCLPRLAGAQRCNGDSAARALPLDSLLPRLAWLYGAPLDGTPRAAQRDMEFVLQEAAGQLRRRFGDADDVIALVPDTLLDMRAPVHFGTTVIRVSDTEFVGLRSAVDSVQPRLPGLLHDAIDSAAELSPPLTQDGRHKPFHVGIAVSSDSTERPRFLPPNTSIAFPVFLVRQARRSPAMSIPNGTQLRYPAGAAQAGYGGNVLLEFVIGADGRVEPASVRDLYASKLAHEDVNARDVYELLQQETIRAVRAGRFVPAAVAGCPVRERVQQSFSFELRR